MQDIKKLFGERVRELRKRKKLTQEQLAELIGIEPRNLLKIENAQTFPRVATMEKLLKTLDITLQELFYFEHLDNIDRIKEKAISAIEQNDNIARLVYKIIC